MAGSASSSAAIELRGVVKDFGGVRVLDGLDLAVPRGAITVLIGPSGAGKTVTVNHIVGLIHPGEGTVEVEGRNLATLSEPELNELRQGMAAVLQGSLPFTCGLFFSMNVYENVASPLRQRRPRWAGERGHEVTMESPKPVGGPGRPPPLPAPPPPPRPAAPGRAALPIACASCGSAAVPTSAAAAPPPIICAPCASAAAPPTRAPVARHCRSPALPAPPPP